MSNINASKFQEMVQAAASRLNEQAEYVNSLNVFPVPDGDTGTNMGMTIENGAKEVLLVKWLKFFQKVFLWGLVEILVLF